MAVVVAASEFREPENRIDARIRHQVGGAQLEPCGRSVADGAVLPIRGGAERVRPGQGVADTEKTLRIHTEFLSWKFFSLPY